MDLIKTGLGLTKTVKNVARFREIVTVLSRNGFDEFVIKTGLHERIPGFVLPRSQVRISESLDEAGRDSFAASIGYRLRKAFEELGPAFVKLGQLLSTREDVFPAEFVSEMRKLQDQVKGIPFDEALAVIEKSLERPWREVFAALDEAPIGTASIGVVYRGKLKSGEDVVVKVRRPHIAKTIETDFTLMRFLVSQVEKVSDDARQLALSKILKDFSDYLTIELDYRVEAMNCERLRQNIARVDTENVFHVPRVYKDVSTDEILVMEFLDGIPFSDAARINRHKAEIKPKLERGIRIFVHNLLVDGFFHADLHGGNFFLLGDGRLGIVDFGLIGTLGKKSRSNLIAILYALVSFNFENLVYEYLEVAEYDAIPDTDALIKDVRHCLTPYMGLTVQQMNFSQLFRSIMATLSRHRIYLPRDWFVIFRALTTLDGVGKSLEVDFDIFGIIDQDIRQIVKDQFSKEELLEEAAWLGRDVMASVRGLPRHLRWFLRELSRRNYALQVRHRGYENELRSLSQSVQSLGRNILAGLLVFSGVWTLPAGTARALADVPMLSWIFWALALFCLGTAWLPKRAKKR